MKSNKKQIQEFEPTDYRIQQLVDKVKYGGIKLPKFQRPFKWKRQDVIKIWDSVYKGYPIGSILLWYSSEKLASERRIGDLDIEISTDDLPTWYLLDGQQRLSSLCGPIYWDGRNKQSIWNVSFDLEDEVFFYPSKGEESISYFPLNKVLDTFSFMEQCEKFRGHEKQDIYKENSERLLKVVKDYRIAAVNIGNMSINEVAPVFERINSSGRKLTMLDLMRAATWSEEFDLNNAIYSIQDILKERYFESVPDTHILRNISASAGNDIHKEAVDKMRDLTPQQLHKAASDTEGAYKLAVDFLNDELQVFSYGYLPYGLQLTFLVEYFRICPTPNNQQRSTLKAWFWDTSFSRHYGKSNTGQQVKDLQLVRNFANGNSMDLTIEEKIRYKSFAEETFRLNNASSKSFGLLLASKRPKSLTDGSSINTQQALANINNHEYHHIFPKAFLKSSGYSSTKINLLPNICLLNFLGNRKISKTRPSIYLADIKNSLGSDLKQVLDSNLITMDAFQAGLDEDYGAFIDIRAKTIIAYMQTLVSEYQKTKLEVDSEPRKSNETDEDDINKSYDENVFDDGEEDIFNQLEQIKLI